MYIKKAIIKLILSLSILLLIVSFAISGYMYIEGWSFFDSLYMTAITITTIGFGEVHPLSHEGKVHTIIVIIVGVGYYSSMIVYFSSIFIEGKLRGVLKIQSMENKIHSLKSHYIICGYGRIGREVCQSLRGNNFIIIEKDEDKAQDAKNDGFLVLKGDATQDEILIEAGIKKSVSIICALTDDALNVFITLSSRVLNPHINIIARADRSQSVEKLKRAGAHMVIAPYVIGGRRMATAATQPFVLDFLDTVLHDDNFDLKLEQILAVPGCELINESIQTSHIRDKSGAIIIAIKKVGDGEFITNPKGSDYIESGDMLIALGNNKQLDMLKKMSGNSKK